MGETSYIIDLTPDGRNRYRHRHVSEKGEILELRVQYEAYLHGAWHTIVRYDTAHGFAHRDLLYPDGTESKTTFQYWDYGDVLTYGERDLKNNWKLYREAYEAELIKLRKGEQNGDND